MHYHIKFVTVNRLAIPTRKTTCPVMWPMTISPGDVISHGRQLACLVREIPLWRHQMETFSALLSFCAGNPPVTGRFPSQKPVTWSFDVFFDLCLNKRLSKQSKRRWFDTPSRTLWPNCPSHVSWHCDRMSDSTAIFRQACRAEVNDRIRNQVLVNKLTATSSKITNISRW